MKRSDLVFRHVRSEIMGGGYAPGQRLPSAFELGKSFGVTESIAQDAVARLKAIGLVRTEPGRGMWVVEAITEHAMMRTVLDAARGGVFLDAMWAADAGEVVEFPAAWIERLLDEVEAAAL